MKLEKNRIKKISIIIFVAILSLYFIWDISVETVNRFRFQGYELAVMQIVDQAENEDCLPFNVFMGNREVDLINMECLQMDDAEVYFDPNDGVLVDF